MFDMFTIVIAGIVIGFALYVAGTILEDDIYGREEIDYTVDYL
jgi:hypothetical protein